jgi:hypothetical protein
MEHGNLILGEIREFKRATLERLDKLEAKSDSYQAFKSKIVGMAAVAAFLTSTLTSVLLIAVEYYRSK